MTRRTARNQMSLADQQARLRRIGGTDARIIMSGDQQAIERLWHIKRLEMEAENLEDVLIVQLGNVTENLNLDWFEKETGLVVTDEQFVCTDPEWPIASCTLDGAVRLVSDGPRIGIMDAKFMLPFYWTIEKAITKYATQLQHNMMVASAHWGVEIESAWLSVIVGDGRWCSQKIEADIFYQMAMRDAEIDFWDCVQTGRTPGNPDLAAPVVPIEPVRVVDMSKNNEFMNYASIMMETFPSFDKHEKAKKSIKTLFTEDMIKAEGGGVTISRSAAGKINIDIAGKKDMQKRNKEMMA